MQQYGCERTGDHMPKDAMQESLKDGISDLSLNARLTSQARA